MRSTLLAILLAVAVAFPASAWTAPQGEDDGTRNFFKRTRPKQRAQVRRTNGSGRRTTKTAVQAEPLGLGYTLFKEGPGGTAVRVSPSQTFRVGDKLRLQIEPNADGYLYVFYTENGKNPTMLYPDARLSRGANEVFAHSLVEIPSRNDPRFQWFKIVGDPAVERIYIAVSREPLPGVPAGDELIRYCATYQGGCPWKPSDALWGGVAELASAPVRVSTVRDDGTRRTAGEEEAITRELVLSAGDAEPTVVAVADASRDMLVSSVDIRHE